MEAVRSVELQEHERSSTHSDLPFAHEMVPWDRLHHSDAWGEGGNLCTFHHTDEFLTCGTRILGLMWTIPQAYVGLLHIWGLKKDKRCHERHH